jgi:hypothetical protein
LFLSSNGTVSGSELAERCQVSSFGLPRYCTLSSSRTIHCIHAKRVYVKNNRCYPGITLLNRMIQYCQIIFFRLKMSSRLSPCTDKYGVPHFYLQDETLNFLQVCASNGTLFGYHYHTIETESLLSKQKYCNINNSIFAD